MAALQGAVGQVGKTAVDRDSRLRLYRRLQAGVSMGRRGLNHAPDVAVGRKGAKPFTSAAAEVRGPCVQNQHGGDVGGPGQVVGAGVAGGATPS